MKSVGVHPCEGLPWGLSNRDTSPLSELVQLSPAYTLTHLNTYTLLMVHLHAEGRSRARAPRCRR